MDWRYPLTNCIYRPISRPLAGLLATHAVTPNSVTYVTGLLGIAAGLLFATGFLLLGLAFTFLTMVFDCVDGDLARIRSMATRRGSYLDSFLDRVVDAALVLGLVVADPTHLSLIGGFTLTGMFLVSYSRTKAEAVGVDCRVGLATRDVRLLIIFVAVIASLLYAEAIYYAFLVLMMASFGTAVHRAAYSMKALSSKE